MPIGRRVLLAGATGLVGGELLRRLLADDTVAVVHVLARRALSISHPKLQAQVVDFSALPPLPALDEAYLALGTTIKVAGSQAAFRAVDFDANLAVARAAFQAGARRLGLVSAMGADAHSRVFYNRVKGELEEAVKALGFDALVIARPSLLLGDRSALGQPARPGEHVGSLLAGVLRPLIPARYRPIRALDVACALLAHVPAARGDLLLSSDAMQG
ncbi:NAD(P)H-binding protein [Massilia niabensis]|uniref:NAD(P)H-binding protein n=1 Tax=Massilia niabensis TaxID=544910 RepID=A0ABW0L748_9BURK